MEGLQQVIGHVTIAVIIVIAVTGTTALLSIQGGFSLLRDSILALDLNANLSIFHSCKSNPHALRAFRSNEELPKSQGTEDFTSHY